MQYKYKNINSEAHRLSLNLLEGFNKLFRLNQTFSMSKNVSTPRDSGKGKDKQGRRIDTEYVTPDHKKYRTYRELLYFERGYDWQHFHYDSGEVKEGSIIIIIILTKLNTF